MWGGVSAADCGKFAAGLEIPEIPGHLGQYREWPQACVSALALALALALVRVRVHARARACEIDVDGASMD